MMRLGDTDAFPASDLGVRRGVRLLGLPARSRGASPAWRAVAALARLRRAAPLDGAPALPPAERPSGRAAAPAPARRP